MGRGEDRDEAEGLPRGSLGMTTRLAREESGGQRAQLEAVANRSCVK